MKESILSVLQRLYSNPSTEKLQGTSAGFMAGLAMAKLDPILAITIDRKLRLEWSMDAENPIAYGPEEMAKHLIKALAPEGA